MNLTFENRKQVTKTKEEQKKIEKCKEIIFVFVIRFFFCMIKLTHLRAQNVSLLNYYYQSIQMTLRCLFFEYLFDVQLFPHCDSNNDFYDNNHVPLYHCQCPSINPPLFEKRMTQHLLHINRYFKCSQYFHNNTISFCFNNLFSFVSYYEQ